MDMLGTKTADGTEVPHPKTPDGRYRFVVENADGSSVSAGPGGGGSSGGVPLTNTDTAGAITAGGVTQTIIGVELTGHAYRCWNTNTGDLRFSDGAPASATVGELVPPGYGWQTSGAPLKVTNAVTVWGATTGQTFTIRRID